MNLADELTNQARLRPDAPAIETPAGITSYRELEDLTWRLAGHLVQNGIKAGHVAALSFASEFALLVTLLATARIGAIAFSLPKNTPPMLRVELAARAQAYALVTDLADAEIAGLHRVLADAGSMTGMPMAVDVRADKPDSPWLMIAGSGTTGHPKLFAVTHEQFFARIKTNIETLSLSPADRLASLMHLDFTSPKERCLSALFAGATVVLFDRRRPNAFALRHDRRVTVLDATAFHLEHLLSTLPKGSKDKLDGLRILLLSASTVSDGLRRRIAKTLGAPLYVRYGTNETGPLSIARPQDIRATLGTIGRPPAGVQIEVVDAHGQAVPPGETGLIRAKSLGMIDRYLDDEQATLRAFQNDWFLPGDLGRFAPAGDLIYAGRADHMMIMNGINIYPAEIERTLSLHPAVRDVAAVPLSSALHQDIPVCAVVLRSGPGITEKALLDFARQRLGAHGPHRIVVLDWIPRNPQGKLIRQQLTREIASKLQHRGSAVAASTLLAAAPYNIEMARLRQPTRQMQISLDSPAPINLKAIDDWLKFALEVGIVPRNCHQALDAEHSPAAELTWRILLLTSALLQAARIPVFDPGCVLNITRSGKHSSRWVATVAVAYLEQIPSRCHSIAVDESAGIIRWINGKPRSPENTQTLFDSIRQRVLHPLQRMVPAGKSTIPVLRAAHGQGIPFSHLGAGIYQLGWGSHSRRMDRSTTGMDSAIGSRLAQNKVWTAALLRRAGLPAPRHDIVATQEEAARAAGRLGWPVVIKPADLDRGEGVTVGIRSNQQLQEAFNAARRRSRSRQLIVEREVGGVCHRLFIANGTLLYAVKRLPKSIHGDGRQTIAELIRAANQNEASRPPWLRTEPYPDDQLAIEAMAAAGFTLESIPIMGERVPLRTIESTAAGGFDEDVTSGIHPDNLDIALRATALFGLDVAGIDIITPDIGKPWHENGAIINEVNFAPLLGGGEISRSHIPEFFVRFMKGDGRIPIEVIVGGNAAMDLARKRQEAFVSRQINCFVTSHQTTLAPDGNERKLPFTSLYQRGKTLLMDNRADAILLVVQTDELLRTGLPVDRIQRITIADEALQTHGNPGQPSLPDSRDKLLALLRSAARTP